MLSLDRDPRTNEDLIDKGLHVESSKNFRENDSAFVKLNAIVASTDKRSNDFIIIHELMSCLRDERILSRKILG